MAAGAVLLPFLALSLSLGAAQAFHPGFAEADLASAGALQSLFLRWRAAHGKPALAAPDFTHRFNVFVDNVRKIQAHNSQKGSTFRMALNQFADLTPEEFKAAYYGLRRSPGVLKRAGDGGEFRHAAVRPPKTRDWRKLGAVTPVKNQGACGSCWAFTATGAIEGINQIVTSKLVSVSEQELVDCDTEDLGCNGGLMDDAFKFVIQNGGLDTEEDYPYNGTDNVCILSKENKHVVTIDDYEDVPENDESALQKAVAAQPVAVGIEADERKFQFYSQGIITSGCGTDLDHGVLAVGYGRMGFTDYWILKNSWGPSWGERGYVRIKRNYKQPEGLCGVAMLASYPIKGTRSSLASAV